MSDQGLSEPESYGDLVYGLKRIVGTINCSAQFGKVISHFKNKLVTTLMYCDRLHAWWSDNFIFLYNCTLGGWTSDSLTVPI